MQLVYKNVWTRHLLHLNTRYLRIKPRWEVSTQLKLLLSDWGWTEELHQYQIKLLWTMNSAKLLWTVRLQTLLVVPVFKSHSSACWGGDKRDTSWWSLWVKGLGLVYFIHVSQLTFVECGSAVMCHWVSLSLTWNFAPLKFQLSFSLGGSSWHRVLL